MNNETFGERGNGVARESCGSRSHDVIVANYTFIVKLNITKVGLHLQQYEDASTVENLVISVLPALQGTTRLMQVYSRDFFYETDITENLLLNGRSFT